MPPVKVKEWTHSSRVERHRTLSYIVVVTVVTTLIASTTAHSTASNYEQLRALESAAWSPCTAFPKPVSLWWTQLPTEVQPQLNEPAHLLTSSGRSF